MEKDGAIQQIDTALVSFLNATGKDSEDALAALIAEQIQPAIKKTLRAKLHVSLDPNDFNQTNQDALELLSEIKLLLISELGKLKSNANGKVIYNLLITAMRLKNMMSPGRQCFMNGIPTQNSVLTSLRWLLMKPTEWRP